MTWQPMRRLTPEEHPLLQADAPDGAPDEVWMNDRFEVSVWRNFRCVEPDGPLADYLSIKAKDKDASHDWRHFQTIKNDICGYERYGIEVYPPESVLQDTVNQYHVFVMPEGQALPFGFFTRREVDDSTPDTYGYGQPRQRPFEPGTRVSRNRLKRSAARQPQFVDPGRMTRED